MPYNHSYYFVAATVLFAAMHLNFKRFYRNSALWLNLCTFLFHTPMYPRVKNISTVISCTVMNEKDIDKLKGSLMLVVVTRTILLDPITYEGISSTIIIVITDRRHH